MFFTERKRVVKVSRINFWRLLLYMFHVARIGAKRVLLVRNLGGNTVIRPMSMSLPPFLIKRRKYGYKI